MAIDYYERIPNNVGLADNRALQRALEQWQPRFLDWWREMGPSSFRGADVYLRTATTADESGWASYGHIAMPDYRWGIVLALEASPNIFPYLTHNIRRNGASNVRAVNVAVADRVDESVHAGLQEVFRVFKRRRPAQVREGFHPVLVCLVDDRAIHLRLELRHAAFTVVNPELDEMNAPGLQLPNVLAALFWRRCAVRNACARFARARSGGCSRRSTRSRRRAAATQLPSI